MILKNASYMDFAKYIKESEKKIIVYGAGMMGKVLAPYIFEQYDLENHVSYYIDADERKQGSQIAMTTKKVFISSLYNIVKENKEFVLLITNSNFYPIVNMLDTMQEFDRIEAYILPIMQLQENKHKTKISTIIKTSEKQLIPKKIHYCWFSGKPIPDNLRYCIESWKKFCPDYEIIRWDETNYDITKNAYMQQAHKNQKWGFVPDIARLDILYTHGGIYMDTDVELIRNLDELLYQPAFCGVEKWGNINTGGCTGTQPQHNIIKVMLDYRKNTPFVYEDGTFNLETCGYYETMPLIKRGMNVNNETQVIDSMTVYPSEFFHPYDYMSGELNVTSNTFSIHHFNGGWLDEHLVEQRAKTKQQYREILKRMNI